MKPDSIHDLSGHSLLAIFAHPDDESLACGGLMARCAERGARVALLCFTRGEHGPGPDRERLADARTVELYASARVLGIQDVVLLEHEDGMLPWIDPATLERDIRDAIERFAPDVVVTFDADGLYWHPDHLTLHERVTAVVAGLGPAAPALRYVSVPEGVMRHVMEAAADDPACAGVRSSPILGIEAVDAFGSGAPAPDLIVEAGSCAGKKVAALRSHRSQVAGTALDCLDALLAARILGTEHYRRAEVGAPGAAFSDCLATPAAATGRQS